MSIQAEKVTVTMRCDHKGCAEARVYIQMRGEKIDWNEFTIWARKNRWSVFSVNGTWHHLCIKHRRDDRSKY